MAKTIAIDFDGVIHKYSKGWQDGSVYDKEIDHVFESIQDIMGEGYSVFILSTRSPQQIKKWLEPLVLKSEYEIIGMGNDPYEWVEPRFGFTLEVIPWWKIVFRKTFFWNKREVLGITNFKLPAHAYIDDRAIKFEGDWTKTLEELRKFKTYQQ